MATALLWCSSSIEQIPRSKKQEARSRSCVGGGLLPYFKDLEEGPATHDENFAQVCKISTSRREYGSQIAPIYDIFTSFFANEIPEDTTALSPECGGNNASVTSYRGS